MLAHLGKLRTVIGPPVLTFFLDGPLAGQVKRAVGLPWYRYRPPCTPACRGGCSHRRGDEDVIYYVSMKSVGGAAVVLSTHPGEEALVTYLSGQLPVLEGTV